MSESLSFCKIHCPDTPCCPLTAAMKKLGGKWKIPILCALGKGPVRYNALLHSITGITNTMLASSLKEMERDGLVRRVQYAEIPVRVEYSLTERCGALCEALNILLAWGREYCMPAGEAAQQEEQGEERRE